MLRRFLEKRREVHKMKKKKESILKIENPFRQPVTDPQGSYTGIPDRTEEEPVQDADDL